jgi:DNA-binding response OmpR family regulator
MSTNAKDKPSQPPHKIISLLREAGPARIILLDDEQFVRDAIKMMLQFYFRDYLTVECANGDEGWSEISRQSPDLLITDYGHPGMRLETLFPLLRENQYQFPILIASAYVSSTPELQKRLLSQPGLKVTLLNKPFMAEDLKTRVISCLNGSFPAQDSQSNSEQHNLGERRSRQRSSVECKPLLEAATKDLFRKNAFRITGLSVDATTREVSRHADKLKMLAELGQDPHTQSAAFPMKPPPSLDEIREAIQKIKDPEKRLVDEFFWFWPEEFGNSQSDPAIQALAIGDSAKAIEIWAAKENGTVTTTTAKHNLALVYHVCALDWENYAVKNTVEADRREKMTNYWKGALDRWETLATSEQFWEQVVARIRQLDEPNLPTGFARRMRATLPEALDKINAELAVAFAESGKIELARLHIKFMRETNQGLDNVEKTAELVLRPAINRFKDQIKHAEECAKGTPQDGAKAAKELIQHSQRAAFLFDLFFGKESDLRNDLLDEAVAVCNRLQVAYHNATHDDETCLEILNSVLPLATSVELRQQIEKNIGMLKGFATDKRLESVYALLKSIQDSKESPSSRLARFKRDAIAAIVKAAGISGFSENYGYLSASSEDFKELFNSAAIVLRGISLDAWNNHQDRQTAVAANDLAIKHATSPDLKQRLTEDSATLQQMGAQAAASAAAQREKSNNTGMGCLIVVGIFIVLGIIGSCNSTNNPSSNNSYTPPAPSAPAYTPPAVAPTAPTYTPPPTFGGGNSGGNAYRVPSSVSSALKTEKEEIESERATIEASEAQIEKLGREIESDRIYLDRNSQYAVDAFNEKVDRYNVLNERAKIANAAFNEKVDNYNAKLQRYGR